jgi:integrase
MTPLKLRAIFPHIQREVRRSLSTAKKSEARVRAAELYFLMNNEFLDIAEKLDTIESFFKLIPGYLGWKSTLSEQDIAILRLALDEIIENKKELLERRFIEDISEQENRLLRTISSFVELIIQTKSDTFISTPEEVQYLFDKITDKAEKLVIRAERATNTLVIPVSKSSLPPTNPEPVRQRNLFSRVSQEFIDERLFGKNWQKKTHDSYSASFRVFKELFGDISVSEINSDLCRDFKSKLKKIPKNHSTSAMYKDLQIQHLLDLNIAKEELLSEESVNKHITRVSGLFNWCVQQSYMSKNFLAGMTIRINKSNANRKRDPFTSNDLNELFSDPIYTAGQMHQNYYFWLPLIALYSGARIQEICQLELKDIRLADDILVFDINNDSRNKRLKNTSSSRLVPVHKTLIDIGLQRYIDLLLKHRKKTLFPELTKNRKGIDGQSQPASKWFARYKKKHGFPTNGIKAFHSFRHSFIDQLKGIETPEEIAAAITGHAHGGITYRIYGSNSPTSLLDKHLQNIKYEGFDYSAIKWFPK